ncbi:MAG: hypothetical protein M0R51_13520 [Clostridia bacterium]|jgi:hypothetical protein|nr:hypothetical protein [Clostridia bacterium]
MSKLTNWQKIKQALKPYASWKMIVSLIIAWALFAGWAVAFVVVGVMGDNGWFYGIGTAFLAWVLFPNGTFLIPFAIAPFIHKLLFVKKTNKGETSENSKRG